MKRKSAWAGTAMLLAVAAPWFGPPALADTNIRDPTPKPLFRDPVHDGAADPVVIWNWHEQKWFIFYTNRRANLTPSAGVE